MGVTLYFSRVSSSLEIKKHQQRIEMVLEGKHIEFVIMDIATNEDAKIRMRELAGDPKALPPQICNGDQYCGDYTAFENAVEEESLNEFLKI